MDSDKGYAWDFFICHASEDKDVARPLYDALLRRSFRVWIDERELTVGDSVRSRIDDGLVRCRFGVVIISRAFFAKNWPQYELDGFTTRQMRGVKVILPVWHGVDASAVAQHSPSLAGYFSLPTTLGLERVADDLSRVARPTRPQAPPPPFHRDDDPSEWLEIGLDDVSAACSLAAKLRVGRRPPPTASPLDDAMPADHHVYWHLPASAWVYAGDEDATYTHRSHDYRGSTTWWLAFRGLDGLRNASARRRVDAVAQPQWRQIDEIELVLANRQMWFVPRGTDMTRMWESFSIDYNDTTSVAVDAGFVVVQTTGAPLGFATYFPNWLYVALTWLRTGRVAQGY